MTPQRDFDAILDQANFGKEPSEHYLERLNALDNVVRECIHVSREHSGIRSPTGRHYYASVLFTSLVTRAVSLLQLAPHSKWAEKIIEHWDYASATVIARAMLEARLAFCYLCTDSCSDDEWQCRWNIFNLHDCTARRRMFDAMEKIEQVTGFDKEADELRERLRSNPFFMTLANGQQKKLLHGQSAYLLPLEDIAERIGIDKATFRWLYVFLSSHVHSLPMSFYRIGGGDNERGRGLPSPIEEGNTSLCLSLTVKLLVGTRDEFRAMFLGLSKQNATAEQPVTETMVAEAIAQPDRFPVGESVDLVKTEDIRLEVKRVSETDIESVYYHQPSNAVVLGRVVSNAGGSYLRDLDLCFWNIQVNGNAATEAIIDSVLKGPYAFKVDYTNRTLSIKTRQ